MKIVFIGPNFFGVGGVEEATVGLAEALADKGNDVTLLSVQKWGNRLFPENVKALRFVDHDDKTIGGKIKKILPSNKRKYSDILVDNYVKDILPPYGMNRLIKYLKKTDADVVISIRESFHKILYDCKNKNIKSKFYYFHARPDAAVSVQPIIKNVLFKICLEHALFVTENSRIGFKNQFGYENYKEWTVLGNTLPKSSILDRSKIVAYNAKNSYKASILTRFSPGKEADLENIISAGHFLQEHSNELKLQIDLYGGGKYVSDFKKRIDQEGLSDILIMKGQAAGQNSDGVSRNISAIRDSDFVMDFSAEQSYGMVYLEAILNGKPVIASSNTGSREVLNQFPDYIFENYDDMLTKILSFPHLSKKELQSRYDKILKRWGPETLAMRFLMNLNDKINI
jgi:glycosyltransferase involved in cell wall biosynthesis